MVHRRYVGFSPDVRHHVKQDATRPHGDPPCPTTAWTPLHADRCPFIASRATTTVSTCRRSNNGLPSVPSHGVMRPALCQRCSVRSSTRTPSRPARIGTRLRDRHRPVGSDDAQQPALDGVLRLAAGAGDVADVAGGGADPAAARDGLAAGADGDGALAEEDAVGGARPRDRACVDGVVAEARPPCAWRRPSRRSSGSRPAGARAWRVRR